MGRKNRNQGSRGGNQRGGQPPRQGGPQGSSGRPGQPAEAAGGQAAHIVQPTAHRTPPRPNAPGAAARIASAPQVAQQPSRPALPAFSTLSSADKNQLITFTATIFVSALLLFSVQPLFAKMVLPVLGGSPSVWAVAMCFFQGALLAGYIYAHFLVSKIDRKVAGIVHLVVCAAAFLFLPIGLPAAWGTPPPGEPYMWQLGLFAVAVGLPFFAVAANAPLLQAWFSNTAHPHRSDPYFLYGASNLGSMIALLAYPFFLEPLFGLRQMSSLWMYLFIILVLLIAACFWYVRSQADAVPATASVTKAADAPTAAPTMLDRARWTFLALIPSALLTAYTTHVSTDIASAPLIWVIPLAFYLLTFVFVFRDKPIVMVPMMALIALLVYAVLSHFSRGRGIQLESGARLLLGMGAAGAFFYFYKQSQRPTSDWLYTVHFGTVIAALIVVSQARSDWQVSATIGLAAFFSTAMVAHRTLYETRPAPQHLTEFYIWLSFGGVLGGIFAALIAPKLFREIYEYPLLIALAMACRPEMMNFKSKNTTDELLTLALMLGAGLLIVMWLPRIFDTTRSLGITPLTAITGLFAMALLYFRIAMPEFPHRQLLMAMLMFAAAVVLPSAVRQGDATVARSYFGVYRLSEAGPFNVLVHGTTLHGAQRVRDEQGNPLVPPDLTPTTYYHPRSPMGQSVLIARERLEKEGKKDGRYGIIGLGSGSMGCHAKAGERWTFFEIDPVMIGLTTNPKNFSFVETCLGKNADIVVGDARLTLTKQPDASFDLLVVDAFSSDAVPVHLMTKEALELFKSKLTPKGIAVLHVSNRYLDLEGVLSATQQLVPDFHGIVVTDEFSSRDYDASSSTVVAFSKDASMLEYFRTLPKRVDTTSTRELSQERREKDLRPWTDDYSDILGPLMARNPFAR